VGGILAISTGIVLLLHWVPRPVLFATDARSEIVRVETAEYSPRRWYISDATADVDGELGRFNGEVELAPGASVLFERLGSGELFVEIEAPSSGGGPAARLEPIGDSEVDAREAREYLAFAVEPEDRGLTLPFSGAAVLGDVVASQSDAGSPILTGGRTRMLARSVLTGRRFEAGSVELDPGSRFQLGVRDGGGTDASRGASGLVRMDDQPGLAVIYHAEGEAARIDRFQSEGYVVRPTWWSYLTGDPLLATLGVVALTILSAFGQSLVDLALGSAGAPEAASSGEAPSEARGAPPPAAAPRPMTEVMAKGARLPQPEPGTPPPPRTSPPSAPPPGRSGG
jgi:hypothetical protein